MVGWEGIKHIGRKENGDRDFSEIIQQAIELGGYPEDEEPQEILVGFGHHAKLSLVDTFDLRLISNAEDDIRNCLKQNI